MKALRNWIICWTSMSLLAGIAFADSSMSSQKETKMQQSGLDQKFFHAKDLIDKKAKSAQGQDLGTIRDILFDPQQGQTFALLDVGNNRLAPVPWQAVNVSGSGRDQQISLSVSKQQLQSGPTLKRDHMQDLNNPSFTQSIYSHYNLQPPTAMGGTGATTTPGPTGRGSSDDQGKNQPEKDQYKQHKGSDKK